MSTIRREQLRSPLSASYALTASYAENANVTFNTGSLVTTSSFNAFTASINSFTASYNTGSFSGSFTGSLRGTASFTTSASYALTASYVLNIPTFNSSSFATTGSNRFLGDQFITGSITTFKEINYQEIFSSAFTASGDIIKTNKIDSSFAVYDLVMYDRNWTISDYTSNIIQNQLGICLYTDGSEALILLSGDITVNDNNSGIGPFVDKADVGYAVIPSDNNGRMNSITRGLLASDSYHRSLGFVYYQNTSNTNSLIMKFNPSNDSYHIIP
jgi:hypothetical protein